MSELARAQHEFQRCLLDGDRTVAARIVGDARASVEQRLDVYYQAYRLRLVEVLQNDFPGLVALLGEDFDAMALAYLAAHPSSHPSVRWFGRRLPAFLSANLPWSEREELAEMAAFEWAWGQAFDAADGACASPQALAAIPPGHWGRLRVVLQPSLHRLRLRWNVPAIFGAVARDEPVPVAARGEATEWLLWRRSLVVHWRSLASDEAWALDTAAGGADFASLCEGLCDWRPPDAVPLHAAGLLKTWLTDGLIVDILAGDPAAG